MRLYKMDLFSKSTSTNFFKLYELGSVIVALSSSVNIVSILSSFFLIWYSPEKSICCLSTVLLVNIPKLITSRVNQNNYWTFSFRTMSNFCLYEVLIRGENFGGIFTQKSKKQVSILNCKRTDRAFLYLRLKAEALRH